MLCWSCTTCKNTHDCFPRARFILFFIHWYVDTSYIFLNAYPKNSKRLNVGLAHSFEENDEPDLFLGRSNDDDVCDLVASEATLVDSCHGSDSLLNLSPDILYINNLKKIMIP